MSTLDWSAKHTEAEIEVWSLTRRVVAFWCGCPEVEEETWKEWTVLNETFHAATVESHAACSVQSSGFRVQGSGFRVQGSGFRVQGPGFISQNVFLN